MPLARALASFKSKLIQCDSLIANAHKLDAAGAPFMPQIDREQVTTAAFLNGFIAWESFLEECITALMIGSPTISGTTPTKYVSPTTLEEASKIIIGTMRFFDYANHQNVLKIVKIYFRNGYPFEPHLSSVFSDLNDLRTMRNASAHISSTTQTALDALAVGLLGRPHPGITLYQLLTAVDPRSAAGDTVIAAYKAKLVVTAELIANG